MDADRPGASVTAALSHPRGDPHGAPPSTTTALALANDRLASWIADPRTRLLLAQRSAVQSAAKASQLLEVCAETAPDLSPRDDATGLPVWIVA